MGWSEESLTSCCIDRECSGAPKPVDSYFLWEESASRVVSVHWRLNIAVSPPNRRDAWAPWCSGRKIFRSDCRIRLKPDICQAMFSWALWIYWFGSVSFREQYTWVSLFCCLAVSSPRPPQECRGLASGTRSNRVAVPSLNCGSTASIRDDATFWYSPTNRSHTSHRRRTPRWE